MRCASQNTPPLEFSGCHQKISSWVIYWDYAIFLGGSLNFTLSISSGAECSSDGARSTWLFSPLGAPFALTHVYCALLLLHCILPIAHTLVCKCLSVCSSFRWQHCALCAFSPGKRLLLHAHFAFWILLFCICTVFVFIFRHKCTAVPWGAPLVTRRIFAAESPHFTSHFPSSLSASHFYYESQINQALESLF